MNMKTFLLSLSLVSLSSGSLARASDLTIDAHSKYSGYAWSELGIKTLVLTAKHDFTAVGHEGISGNSKGTSATGFCAFQQNGISNISRGTTFKYTFGLNQSYGSYTLLLQPQEGVDATKTIQCVIQTSRKAENATLDDFSAFLEEHFTVQGIGVLN